MSVATTTTRVTFEAPHDPRRGVLRVCGSCPALGSWDPDKAPACTPVAHRPGHVACAVDVPTGVALQYKLALFEGGSVVLCEAPVENHTVTPAGAETVVQCPDMGAVPTRDLRRTWLGRTSLEIQLEIALDAASPADASLARSAQVSAYAVRPGAPRVAFERRASGRLHARLDAAAGLPYLELDVFGPAGDFAGRAHVSASDVAPLRGEVCRPVVGPQLGVVAWLRARFLVAEPLRHAGNDLCGVRAPRAVPWLVGHRGGGATSADRVKGGALPENTLLSFVLAAETLQTAAVEFDVQLTSDGVPVINHNLHVPLRADCLHGGHADVSVPLNKLDFETLRRMRPRHADPAKYKRERAASRGSRPGDDQQQLVYPSSDAEGAADDELSHPDRPCRPTRSKRRSQNLCSPAPAPAPEPAPAAEAAREPFTGAFWKRSAMFPKLSELFEYVPREVGFDVEIKYPEEEQERELAFRERNAYVDAILGVLLDKAGERPLFISSFDVDVCRLAALKQARFPVTLLTTGGDLSTSALTEKAIDVAHSAGLYGVVTWTVPVMGNLEAVIKSAHDKGMVLMTYGADNNNPELVQKQLDAGMDVIITDYVPRIKKACTKH
eukprot:m51a1_g10690 hypothetical protein (610) ;mRNA; r:128238-130649